MDESIDKAAEGDRRGCGRAGCWIGLAVGCILVGLLAVSIPSILSWWIHHRVLGAAGRAVLDDWKNHQLQFPERYLRSKKPSADLLRMLQGCATQTEALPGATLFRHPTTSMTLIGDKLNFGSGLTREEKLYFDELLTASQRLVSEVRSAVRHPDYSVEDTRWLPGERYSLSISLATPLMVLHSHATSDTRAAIEMSLDAIRIFRRDMPYSFGHLPPAGLQSLCSHVRRSEDAAVVREALGTLLHLRREVQPPPGDYSKVARMLAHLDFAQKQGFPVDLRPNQTAAEYTEQFLRVDMELPRFQFERLPLSSPMRAYYARQMVQTERLWGVRMKYHTRQKLLLAMCPDLLYLEQLRNPEPDDRWEQTLYDLACLDIALHMLKLEGKTPPSSPCDYTTVLLGMEIPAAGDVTPQKVGALPCTDCYSGTTYLYHSASEQFYSIGPDMRDDSLAKMSNEDHEEGDLAVRYAHEPVYIGR